MSEEFKWVATFIGIIISTVLIGIVNWQRTNRVEKNATEAVRKSETVWQGVTANTTKLQGVEDKAAKAQDEVGILARVMTEKFTSLEAEVRAQRDKIDELNTALALTKRERDEEHKRADVLAYSLKELNDKIASMSKREVALKNERDSAVLRANALEKELKEAVIKMHELDNRIVRLEAERDEARRNAQLISSSSAQTAKLGEDKLPSTGVLRAVSVPSTSELGETETGILTTQGNVFSLPSSLSEVIRVLAAQTFIAFRPKPVNEDFHRWIALVDPVAGWVDTHASPIQATGALLASAELITKSGGAPNSLPQPGMITTGSMEVNAEAVTVVAKDEKTEGETR